MIKHNQNGAVNALLIPLILSVMLLAAAVGFGVWAYNGRQDYKNNVDQKIAVAVTEAKAQEDKVDAAQFAQAAKVPLQTYTGPEAYGSVIIKYPKTWSSYVDTTGSQNVVDGYFAPGTVPSISDTSNNFALRVQVISQPYSQTLTSLANQPGITTSPYSPAKVPSVVGVRVEGQIQQTKTGSMIILPLRADTLELWTESNQYENDFNNNILPNFSFSP